MKLKIGPLSRFIKRGTSIEDFSNKVHSLGYTKRSLDNYQRTQPIVEDIYASYYNAIQLVRLDIVKWINKYFNNFNLTEYIPSDYGFTPDEDNDLHIIISPIVLAAKYGYINILKWLIKNDVRADYDMNFALMSAMFNSNNKQILSILFNNGASFTGRAAIYEESINMIAEDKHWETIIFMLNKRVINLNMLSEYHLEKLKLYAGEKIAVWARQNKNMRNVKRTMYAANYLNYAPGGVKQRTIASKYKSTMKKSTPKYRRHSTTSLRTKKSSTRQTSI